MTAMHDTLEESDTKRINETMKECGLEATVDRYASVMRLLPTGEMVWDLKFDHPGEVTFAQLCAVAEKFNTKDIDLGTERGYYGSIYDHMHVRGVKL